MSSMDGLMRAANAVWGSPSATTNDDPQPYTPPSAKFVVGECVEIVGFTLGQGRLQKGNLGIIRRADLVGGTWCYIIDAAGVRGWNGVEADLRKLTRERAQQAGYELQVETIAGSYLHMLKCAGDAQRRELDRIYHDLERVENEAIALQRRSYAVGAVGDSLYKISDPAQSGTSVKVQVEQLLKDYEEIEIDGLSVKALTKPVTIRYDGIDVEVGKFKVCIYGGGDCNSIRIHNVTHKEDLCDHPHIKNGIPCWGSYSRTITKYMAEYTYLQLLSTIANYLYSFNRGDDYRHLFQWLPAEKLEQVCTNCWYSRDACRCEEEREEETCEHCGNHRDNCECPHCPDTGELLAEGYGDSYCQDCNSYNHEENYCEY